MCSRSRYYLRLVDACRTWKIRGQAFGRFGIGARRTWRVINRSDDVIIAWRESIQAKSTKIICPSGPILYGRRRRGASVIDWSYGGSFALLNVWCVQCPDKDVAHGLPVLVHDSPNNGPTPG
jgi:hypothetical protein